MRLTTVLQHFLESDDFKDGVIASTKASWGGSNYVVELKRDDTWRVIWSSSIGNRYETEGVILTLPALDVESTVETGDGDDLLDVAFSSEEEDLKADLEAILEADLEDEEDEEDVPEYFDSLRDAIAESEYHEAIAEFDDYVIVVSLLEDGTGRYIQTVHKYAMPPLYSQIYPDLSSCNLAIGTKFLGEALRWRPATEAEA